MRFLPCLPLALAALLSGTPAAAQNAPSGAPAGPAALQKQEQRKSDKRIERIVVEDDGVRIDEVRVGGEPQSLTVQPKADLPAYEIQPVDGARNRIQDRDIRGGPMPSRVWNVLRF